MDSPQVTKFCNEGLRPCADIAAALYFRMKALVESYDVLGIDTSLKADQTFSDLIVDGSESDGRPRISAGGVAKTVENIKSLLTQLETTDAGTGLTMIQGILSIAPKYGN